MARSKEEEKQQQQKREAEKKKSNKHDNKNLFHAHPFQNEKKENLDLKSDLIPTKIVSFFPYVLLA